MAKTSIIPKAITDYDLRLLRIFKTVVENGGFAAAENDLGVTRSTISLHMSNLETRMQLKLCLRGRAGFSLTEVGQSVYHATNDLFDSLNDFSLFVNSLSSELSGELVILCADQLDIMMQKKLAQMIKMIHENSPNLHLVLDVETINNIEKLLLKDKAHIALIPGYQKVEGLNYQFIYNEPIYLCCSKNHLFFNYLDKDITPSMLAEAPAIHPGIDINSAGREQLKKLNLAAKAYQFNTRKAMILSGSYIGFLPQSIIQKELDDGEFKLIQSDKLTYTFNLSLVSKTSPRELKKISLLKNVFDQVFSAK